MSPRRDFGNHAAEARMQIGLRGDDIGEDVKVLGKNRRRRFVAGSFNREEVGHRISFDLRLAFARRRANAKRKPIFMPSPFPWPPCAWQASSFLPRGN